MSYRHSTCVHVLCLGIVMLKHACSLVLVWEPSNDNKQTIPSYIADHYYYTTHNSYYNIITHNTGTYKGLDFFPTFFLSCLSSLCLSRLISSALGLLVGLRSINNWIMMVTSLAQGSLSRKSLGSIPSVNCDRTYNSEQ